MVTESQPGHNDHIKQINAGAVYRLIDMYGPLSRIDLSRMAGLAPASITKIVRELIEAHLVREMEMQGTCSRGRPATGLMVQAEAWHYLSVHIGEGVIAMALRRLNGTLVVEEEEVFQQISSAPFMTRITQYIDRFFTRQQQRLERLTAIAVTLPGSIHGENGTVCHIPFYGVRDIPLAQCLEQHTGVSVFMQHDVSAWALAEAMLGASRGVHNVIQVVIDSRVSACVITDGKLLHRVSGNQVEMGHIQVLPHGKRCHCGNHGCLETLVGAEGLLAQAQQRMTPPLTVASLCQRAREGEGPACELIHEAGIHIGYVLAVMVNLFNPQKILIGSPLNATSEILYPAMLSCIRQQSLPAYHRNVDIVATRFDSCGTVGGIALIKEAMYNGTLLIRLLQG